MSILYIFLQKLEAEGIRSHSMKPAFAFLEQTQLIHDALLWISLLICHTYLFCFCVHKGDWLGLLLSFYVLVNFWCQVYSTFMECKVLLHFIFIRSVQLQKIVGKSSWMRSSSGLQMSSLYGAVFLTPPRVFWEKRRGLDSVFSETGAGSWIQILVDF